MLPITASSSSAHGTTSLSPEQLIRSPSITLPSSQPIPIHPTVGRGVGSSPQVFHVPYGGLGCTHTAQCRPTP